MQKKKKKFFCVLKVSSVLLHNGMYGIGCLTVARTTKYYLPCLLLGRSSQALC